MRENGGKIGLSNIDGTDEKRRGYGMSKVLEFEQREQAGSGSYNRFEYQVHWIVCHIIGQLESNTECIIFCEFHELPSDFDDVFDVFIQNTFVHKSELQLSTYTTQVSGMFFNQLADKNIPADTAHLIFQQLVNDVRKKSAEQIKTPISFKSLVDKKGIEVSKINDKINLPISKKGNYTDFHNYLLTQGLKDKRIESY